MANPFDQFDPAPPAQDAGSGAPQAAPAQASNPFDQFDAPAKPAPEPGFLTRVGNDLSARNDQVNNAVGQFGVGPTSLLAGVGKGVAGSANDIIGEGVKSAYTSLPDAVTKPINKAASTAGNYIANTDAGKYMLGKAGEASNIYKNFAAQNPATASDLESVGDIGAAAANLVPLAKGATEVGGPLVDAVGPSVAKFATDEGTRAGIVADANAAKIAMPTAPQIRNVAGRAFDKADELGGMLTPDETNTWISRASQNLPQSPEARLLEGDTPVTKYVENLQSLQDRPLSYQALDDIDKGLTRKIDGERKPDGTLTPEGSQWVGIQSDLRSTMSDPGVADAEGNEGLAARKQAQGLWAQQARLDEVQRAFNRGNSREIPITGIRNEFRSIEQSPKRFNLYTPEEQKLISNLASSSATADMVRTAGSRLINYLAIGHGNPAGVLAAQFGTRAARDFGSSLKEGMLNKLQGQILSRQELPSLDRPYQYNQEAVYGRPQLEAPPIYGQSPPGPASPSAPQPQKLLPRGNEDTYYQPQGRSLTYQPRADFEVDSNGIADKPPNVAPPAKRPVEGAIASRAGDEMADRNVKRLMITHQPRSNFIATDNGIVQVPSNRVGALLGEDQDMPIDSGELQSIRGNPRYGPGNARGGVINKKKGGAVFARPKSYPALEKRA